MYRNHFPFKSRHPKTANFNNLIRSLISSPVSIADSKWYPFNSLRWRHNDHAGVSNHQPHGCLLNRLFRRKSKNTSKLRVTGLCAGNSPGTGEFPAQMASCAENVSIWWRHHVYICTRWSRVGMRDMGVMLVWLSIFCLYFISQRIHIRKVFLPIFVRVSSLLIGKVNIVHYSQGVSYIILIYRLPKSHQKRANVRGKLPLLNNITLALIQRWLYVFVCIR